jgi:hypothetical protein
MPSRLNGMSNIGAQPFEFVQGVFSACSVRTRSRHMTLLEGICDRLFLQPPSSVQETYWALREKYWACPGDVAHPPSTRSLLALPEESQRELVALHLYVLLRLGCVNHQHQGGATMASASWNHVARGS